MNDGNRVLGPFVGFRTSRDRGTSWQQPEELTVGSSIFKEEQVDVGGGIIRIGAPHFACLQALSFRGCGVARD